jgi:glycosyltransferase involved in cell wall biosynthesis
MNKLSISVIIVVQNGELYLKQAIESVLTQTHTPNEIIVVNGHSRDNTEKIVKLYPNVSYIHQKGKGLANARNTGIDVARGELITFLDHDDYWRKDKLSIQLSYLTSNPEIQYSYSKVKLFLESGCKLRIGFSPELLEKEQIGRTPGTLMVRKSLFSKIGDFNPEFSIGCDVEWFTRAKDYNISYAFIPKVLLYKRVHNTNLSANVQTNRKELLSIIKQSIERQRKLKRFF